MAAGAVDLLDAGERVGAFAAAGRHHEVAGAVVGDAGGADRGGIGRGVSPAAADDRVVAAEAGQRVGTGIAGELVVALRSRKGQPGGAGWVRFQSDVDDVVVINIAGMRDGRVEGAAELVKHVESGVEAGDRIAGDGAAVGIDKGDAAVAVSLRGGPAGQGVVGDGYGAGIAAEDDDAACAAGRAAIADVGDGVVVDGGVRAAEVAVADDAEQRPDLDAVLCRVGGMGADDGVVVDVGRQRRSVDENAGLLETADGRVLDLDRVSAGAAMGGVVTGGQDRVVALDAGDVGAGQFVGTLRDDTVDVGIGIEHVDSHKVVIGRRIRNAGLVAPIDGHACDRDVGVTLDRDDRVFGRPGRVGIRSVGHQRRRIRCLDDGLAAPGAVNSDVLAVDRHLLAIGPRGDLDRVTVPRCVDRSLNRGVGATKSDGQSCH